MGGFGGGMMDFISVTTNNGIVNLVLNRGKVNALNDQVIAEIQSVLTGLEKDPDARAVIMTGTGSFFSFGFDVPEFLSYPQEAFKSFITQFTGLYTYMFLYPKPIVAALNGHTIAGGCMLALACDRRIMVSGRAKISLNEISFGAPVFAGSTEMLRFCAGNNNATEILYSGAMYTAEEAKPLGLIDKISCEKDLADEATRAALELSAKPGPAFTTIKLLLRSPVADEMRLREKETIDMFLDIWYSDTTREYLKKIIIH